MPKSEVVAISINWRDGGKTLILREIARGSPGLEVPADATGKADLCHAEIFDTIMGYFRQLEECMRRGNVQN